MLQLYFVCLLALTTTEAEDTKAIEKLLADRVAAWEKHDADALVATLDENVDYVASNGDVFQGREAIRQQYKKLFASPQYQDSVSNQQIKRIQPHRFHNSDSGHNLASRKRL